MKPAGAGRTTRRGAKRARRFLRARPRPKPAGRAAVPRRRLRPLGAPAGPLPGEHRSVNTNPGYNREANTKEKVADLPLPATAVRQPACPVIRGGPRRRAGPRSPPHHRARPPSLRRLLRRGETGGEEGASSPAEHLPPRADCYLAFPGLEGRLGPQTPTSPPQGAGRCPASTAERRPLPPRPLCACAHRPPPAPSPRRLRSAPRRPCEGLGRGQRGCAPGWAAAWVVPLPQRRLAGWPSLSAGPFLLLLQPAGGSTLTAVSSPGFSMCP